MAKPEINVCTTYANAVYLGLYLCYITDERNNKAFVHT